jgi:hypothetical protein
MVGFDGVTTHTFFPFLVHGCPPFISGGGGGATLGGGGGGGSLIWENACAENSNRNTGRQIFNRFIITIFYRMQDV